MAVVKNGAFALTERFCLWLAGGGQDAGATGEQARGPAAPPGGQCQSSSLSGRRRAGNRDPAGLQRRGGRAGKAAVAGERPDSEKDGTALRSATGPAAFRRRESHNR